LDSVSGKQPQPLGHLAGVQLLSANRRSPISPKSGQQLAYVQAIQSQDLVFGIGPAGTGKTYLAMAMAVDALKRELVKRVILTRPAVEAGEALGFLPGDLQEKIFPYLRPLYDALYDMISGEEIQKFMDRGVIEIAPLAYMRGRTLNNAFVILDEAQNTTAEQMFMFLTRLGMDSKCVVTGDYTQIDLPPNKASGLIEAMHALKNVTDIQFVEFTERDVVRHPLVQSIIHAYRAYREAPRNVQPRPGK
jgi:phosphate starvation-inducible protein PhoH and related proteins